MSKDIADLLKFPFQKGEEKWENVICKLWYCSYTKFLTGVLQSKEGMRACRAITGAGSYRHSKRKHTWVLSQNIWGHLLLNIFWIKFKLRIKEFSSLIVVYRSLQLQLRIHSPSVLWMYFIKNYKNVKLSVHTALLWFKIYMWFLKF